MPGMTTIETHIHTPVGGKDIAERLGVRPNTVAQWLLRPGERFPANRWLISSVIPAWCWECDIEPWAIETGRAQ